MSGRFDFVKDPQDRDWIARWQVASVVMLLALVAAVMLYGPTTEQAVAGAEGAQRSGSEQAARPPTPEPEPRAIGYGEGA